MNFAWIVVCVFSNGQMVGSDTSSFADFDRSVAPILARRCLDCHSGPEPKGKLDLSARVSVLAGGASGPVLSPGEPDESLLWMLVEDGAMPPREPLPPAEAQTLRGWIAAGAPWGADPIDRYGVTTDRRAGRDWWSLAPLRRPEIPSSPESSSTTSPIDALIQASLRDAGLNPAPMADRRVLIRRVTFDLTGLPPTSKEVEGFVADERADAYKRLVDRLLASPQYGVRWARGWLDLARFGESNGFEHDEFRPDAWRYRDWVVRSLNDDLPYDEFARLQIAGDLIRPDDPLAVEATGFLVAGSYDSVGQSQQSAAMRQVVRQDELEDLVGTVGQTFLGLTVNCARCHDHKFDPIPQVDYYRLASALDGVRHGVREFEEPGPEPSSRRAYAVAPAPPGVTHLLLRGDPSLLDEVVAPGGLSAFGEHPGDLGLAPEAPDADRRTRLAAWISSPENPLFARVIVNRVWRAHFGAGLVETPSDFGFNGGTPSHPEVLDWLSVDLVEHGWSLKHLHRRILASDAYRRSARYDSESAAVDAGNRLLWRKPPQRLEAEMVRDAMLAVSGVLDPALGGPGFRDFEITKAEGTITTQYLPVEATGPSSRRRTLFRTWARGGRSGFLDALDCPDPSTTAPVRNVTNTPLQALAMMNNALVLDLADRFAERLVRESVPDPGAMVDRAYHLAFGRMPTDAERSRAVSVVEGHGLPAVCRAIFNSNEFLFID